MMKKEEVKVDPVGVEFEIEGQGGIYLLAVTGDKTDVSEKNVIIGTQSKFHEFSLKRESSKSRLRTKCPFSGKSHKLRF